jgi:PAS domain S-box-containing protein
MISDRDHAKLHDLLIQELEEFAVFLVNLDGRITSWNPGVERFLGYVEAEFVGRPVSDIFTPEDRAARVPEKEMENAQSTGRAADMRWHLRNDQSRVFVEGMFIAIKDEAGRIVVSRRLRALSTSDMSPAACSPPSSKVLMTPFMRSIERAATRSLIRRPRAFWTAASSS